MRSLFATLIAIVMALTVTSCSLRDIAEVTPDRYDRDLFERQVSKSVRRAVLASGIDNGSTLIVTMSGDTIVAPRDSSLRASEIRTVYVDIQSPAYPKAISSRSLKIFTVISIVSVIAGAILLILIGVFVVVIRRQHGRNKAINHAIDQNYPLPEAFFTGVPAAAPVTINRITETITERVRTAGPHTDEPSSDNGAAGPSCPPPPPAAEPILEPGISTGNIIDRICRPGINRTRDLRNSFVLIGMALVLFMAFLSANSEMMAFLCGGSLFVLGLAKLLSIYFSNRF